MRFRTGLAAASVAVAVAGGAVAWHAHDCEVRSEAVRMELAGVAEPDLAPQKVIYHITDDGGFFDRRHLSRLENLSRHVAALGPGHADIRVVLQGAGLTLLERAAQDETVHAKVEALRRAGVHFELCRNSMIDRGVGLAALSGAAKSDIVAAALPEIARLEAAGYVYIRL